MSTPERFDDLPILAELREALDARFRAAARPGSLSLRRARGWASSGLRAVPMVLAAAVAVLVAVGALTVFKPGASHRGAPPGGGRHPSALIPGEKRRIGRAITATILADHGCKPAGNRGRTFLQGAPPQSLRSQLEVLRRPALPADATTRTLYNNGFDAGAGVYVHYIRRARTEYGKAFYLIPEASTNPVGPIPQRCYAEMRATLKRELRHEPVTVTQAALAAGVKQIQTMRLQALDRAGLCFAVVSVHHRGKMGGVDEGCSSGLNWLRHPVADQGIGERDRAGGTIYAAVVPDWVTSATLEFKAGGGDPARAVTSRAVNNVVVFKIPPRTYHQAFPAKFIVRGAGGRVVMAP
jgi:hypothetical protein